MRIPFDAFHQPVGDQLRWTLADAVELANRRALKSGRRQRVSVRLPSTGRFVVIHKTTYAVQEIR